MEIDKDKVFSDIKDRALLEMQEHVLNLIIRISCLEKLLIDKVVDKEEYKKEIAEAATKVNSIVADKLKEKLSQDKVEEQK